MRKTNFIFDFLCPLFFIIIGFIAIISFVILAFCGEDVTKWIKTLILAMFLVIFGIIEIRRYKKYRKKKFLSDLE